MRTPFFWGFAEASFFILVPDIAITLVALFAGWRAGLRAVGWAVVGAMAGGLLVFFAPHAWQSFFPHLPGIPAAMMGSASVRFEDSGWWAVMMAPLSGIPFKLYAAEAAIQGRPWWQLLVVTPFARGWRFLLAFALSYALGALLRWQRVRAPLMRWPWVFLGLHVFFWIFVYLQYFRYVNASFGGNGA